VKPRHALPVAIAAAVIVTSAGAAAPTAKTRVAIEGHGVADGSLYGKFVFTPFLVAKLKRDSGTEQSEGRKTRSYTREGQTVTVNTWVTTAKGKRGTFVYREVLNIVDAGNGVSVGTGTWTFVRGTGQYEGLRGGGRQGQVHLDGRDNSWSQRREGFLTLP
jgi:hypothetical protein